MTTLFARVTASGVGAGTIVVAALALSAPAQATSFHDLCLLSPENYGDGAVRGVFSTEKRGSEVFEVCRVYDEKDYLRGTQTELIRRYQMPRAVPSTAVLSR